MVVLPEAAGSFLGRPGQGFGFTARCAVCIAYVVRTVQSAHMGIDIDNVIER